MQHSKVSAAAVPATAHVDWLSFTVPGAADRWIDMWESLHPLLGQSFSALAETKVGWNGYAHRFNIGPKGEFGLIAYGGASQRGSVHVSLNAHACARVPDWSALVEWSEQRGARVARLDLAHDDLDGSEVNLVKAREWLVEGGFDSCGRPPSRKLVDDLGTGKGSTLYVGDRKNGKLARLYEKGKQLGDVSSAWFRVEVEWRGKDRVIPWEALLTPGDLLAGAYPCFAFLSAVKRQIRTCKQATQITYNRMVEWLRTAAGPAINAMLMVNAGDAFGVVEILLSDKLPKRLIDFQRYLPPTGGGKGLSHVPA